MKKINHLWLWILLGCIAVFFIAPILINVLYKFSAPVPLLAVNWDARDALSYFGSALGGLGTILLGVITVRLTKQIKASEDDRTNANTKRPFFIITEITVPEGSTYVWGRAQNGYMLNYKNAGYSSIKVVNVGDGPANNLTILPWGFGEVPKEHRPNYCVPPDGFCMIPIRLQTKQSSSSQKISIIYENIIGYAYSQQIELNINYVPIQTGETITPEGDRDAYYDDSYEAAVYNIESQIPRGMNKYDNKKGIYDIKI